MSEIITTGRTVDEAVEDACNQLSLGRDDVSVEIIDLPQKKLFSTIPAKVKVTALDDGFSVKALFEAADRKKTESEAAVPSEPAARAPVAQSRPQPISEPQHTPAPQKTPSPFYSETPTPVSESAYKPKPETVQPDIPLALDELPSSAAVAYDYLRMLCAGIGAEKLSYSAAKTDRGIKFVVDGDDASILIGRRGETMDAVQYLCTLVSSRSGDDYSKISVDVAGYREKRERTLKALAIKVAGKVKKSRYSQTLEPMNPYERRIVHSEVQLIEGVKSESVGTEPNRRVVISLISGGRSGRDSRGGRPAPRGGFDKGSHGGTPRPPRSDYRKPDFQRTDDSVKTATASASPSSQPVPAPRQTEAPVPAAPHKEEKKASCESAVLYGKIEL
ncbi:MAG: RNA-binding cell elongation regulator Jag/EloR [Oscillospiraceae bacterium]